MGAVTLHQSVRSAVKVAVITCQQQVPALNKHKLRSTCVQQPDFALSHILPLYAYALRNVVFLAAKEPNYCSQWVPQLASGYSSSSDPPEVTPKGGMETDVFCFNVLLLQN